MFKLTQKVAVTNFLVSVTRNFQESFFNSLENLYYYFIFYFLIYLDFIDIKSTMSYQRYVLSKEELQDLLEKMIV